MARPICKKLRLPEMILSNTSRAVQKLVRSPQFAQARGQAPRIYLTHRQQYGGARDALDWWSFACGLGG